MNRKSRSILFGGGLALLVALVSCGDSPTYDPEIPVPFDSSVMASEDAVEGFVNVRATGAQVILGTADPSALTKERSQVKAKFDYDFSIGKHEVTCGEYNEIARKTKLELELECPDENLPASQVTFYDAVLFANAKSKLVERDTAYRYMSAEFDKSGHCVELGGYRFVDSSNGFRLPTEAEWMLVAKQGWNTEFSWNAHNSDYKKHEVCSMPANELGVCDMAGNMMEWVNDWLGLFRDTALVDFVGAPDAGGFGERVVKGGSYRNDPSAIKLSNRTDVYTVTSSSHDDYVGFRLAYGAIPAASWMNSSGEVSSKPVLLRANSKEVKVLTGSSRTTLVFRNEASGKLAYIDFLSPLLSVKELESTEGAFHPDVSPDGRWVAYCTGLEGVKGKSELHVRKLDSYDTVQLKLEVESAAIPRWRVLKTGDTAIVYVTDAGNNVDAATFAQASTWQVPFKGGKFGTPVKLLDGAYHGGISTDNRLAVTGARLLRARVAGPKARNVMTDGLDTVWYGGAQACNASLATDGTKRTAFLDFGEGPGRDFVGESYGVHERIFIADSTGKLVHSVAAPAGYSFDHVEWAHGAEDILVATLADMNGNHRRVVAVNLDDSSLVDLAEGEDLWHPCLWTQASSGEDFIDLDSAGVYLAPGFANSHLVFRKKMELFWKRLPYTQIICLGSSRMQRGLNPDMYPEMEMLNMGATGIEVNREIWFMQNYVFNHLENIKVVALAFDFDGYRGEANFVDDVFLSVPGYVYDANHDFWKDGLPPGFVDAVESFVNPYDPEMLFSARGNHLWQVDGKWNSELLNDSAFTPLELKNLEIYLDYIETAALYCSMHGVHFVGIVFPQSPKYRETGSFGLYGMKRSLAESLLERFRNLEKTNPYFHLMDENKMGYHDYTDEMAQDKDHLNYRGARQLTERFVELVRTFEK